MRTLKLTIAYDGTRYAGWQVQKTRARGRGRGARERRTIQGALERVLKQILRESVKVVGSGRTDAGVHAQAQVAHLKTANPMAPERLRHSLNALLPPDIAVLQVEETAPGFHARFDTVRKRYRYRIFTGPVVPPFIRPYVAHVRMPLNVALMRREAAVLRGRHDFKAFTRASSLRSSATRVITRVRLDRRQDEIQLEIEGTGFLHTMVRSIAGTLIEIGRGRLPSGTVRRMLRTGERRLAGATAPARGLALVEVSYGVRMRKGSG